MRLPTTAHTSRPWRIHELTPDFVVEDVWALPTPGGPDDFDELVRQFGGNDFPDRAPLIVRVLWEARWVLGRGRPAVRTRDDGRDERPPRGTRRPSCARRDRGFHGSDRALHYHNSALR